MRIGLYGGAFNPVHNGHMAVARAALREARLDKLIFIPSGNAPHKAETRVSRSDRFNMLMLAVQNEPKMEISDYELMRAEVSYSADTAEHFKSVYNNDELFFIIGDDSYNELSSWHEPQRIMNVCTLLVFPRNGAEVLPPAEEISMKRVQISSSNIRERIKNGKDVKNLLPKAVFDYIINKKIYMD